MSIFRLMGSSGSLRRKRRMYFITHTYPLSRIDEAYDLFEKKQGGVIKIAVEC